ncbi:CLUMA_CG019912, isoform A [Clunio marinus]|uniref:CLUMA_CG019912, isoform A n=1 Tax=Clunio marinus TaxID=568069 RepID=A0A1J1J3G1_9DIPT|nr:CLUMA_CG019912, isoform A [Clunio marinus]
MSTAIKPKDFDLFYFFINIYICTFNLRRTLHSALSSLITLRCHILVNKNNSLSYNCDSREIDIA